MPLSDSASLRETAEAVQGEGTGQEGEEDDEEGHSRRKLEGKLSLCCPLPSSPSALLPEVTPAFRAAMAGKVL